MDAMPIGSVSTPDATRGMQLATPAAASTTTTTTRPLAAPTGFDAAQAATGADPLAAAARAHAAAAATSPAATSRTPGYAGQRALLLDKLARLEGTIDPAEARLVEELLRRSDERGSFLASELARVMVRVEGSARGLPPAYLAAADGAQRIAEQVEGGMQELVRRFVELQRSGTATTAELMELFEALEGLASQLEQVQVGLRRNFELAVTDPQAALRQLEAGLGAV